ncbi:MAG: FAD-binding oxidoreductase [Gemmatimonadales bacterium]
MSPSIVEYLRTIAGGSVSTGPGGIPRVTPDSVDAVAAVLGRASEQGWRVRVEGHGTWMPADAPADLAVSTGGLRRLLAMTPADLVASVQAGASLAELERIFAGHRSWLPIDPPGGLDRSLGSVLATGTAGPLRHRFGPVKDHVLGTTVVTGDGRIIRAGGIVVKNVAGYDLTKIQIGGFSAFGVIVEANLRLRAFPATSITLLARGGLDPLLEQARYLREASVDLAILELCSPALLGSDQWSLVVRVIGTTAGVAAEVDRVRSVAAGLACEPLDSDQAGRLDRAIAKAALDGPVSLRAGVLAAGTPDLVDALGETVGHGRLLASLGAGGVRWIGNPTEGHVRALRHRFAEREVPITVERAPWAFRRAVGHFGAFREGVRPLTERVRSAFDPKRTIVADLEASE